MSLVLPKPFASGNPAVDRTLKDWHLELEKAIRQQSNHIKQAISNLAQPQQTAAEQRSISTGQKGVQNQIGQTSQPQQAQASYVTTLPPSTDPKSQTDTLVSFYDSLYRWDDPSQSWVNQGLGKSVNITSVTASANSTGEQNLMSFAAAAGLLNTLNRTLIIEAAGTYTTPAGQTPVLHFSLSIGGTNIITWAPITTSASATNMPWLFRAILSTAVVGSSGELLVTGWGGAVAGTSAPQPATISFGTNTGPSSAFDLTSALTIQTTVRFSTNAVSSNSCTQLSEVVEVLG